MNVFEVLITVNEWLGKFKFKFVTGSSPSWRVEGKIRGRGRKVLGYGFGGV